MTVLGIGNEKADDKEQLVGKDVATIMPNRLRLLKLQRKRSLITLILSIGFILIFLCGIFLTVCYIKKIGPFKRHYMGKCPVGGKRFNGDGHTKAFESYEITDNYALIHVPRFNLKHRTFDSVRTLHVFDKKLTVIQHHGMCFVKPMMEYQILRSDWFDKLHMLTNHHFRTPNRFAYYRLQIIRPQLPDNYLHNEVLPMAAAMCNTRPVFRLEYKKDYIHFPFSYRCNVKCDSNCPAQFQEMSWKLIENKRCRVCHCKQPVTESNNKLHSSNRVDPNCKAIRCENKCVDTSRPGCVLCRCMDDDKKDHEQSSWIKKDIVNPPLRVDVQSNPAPANNGTSTFDDRRKFFPIYTNNNEATKVPEMKVFKERQRFEPIFDYDRIRQKRSLVPDTSNNCKLLATIYEGYTPFTYDIKVPLDYIYEC